MRNLSNRTYTAVIQDGDEQHRIQYRRPTNKELHAYHAYLFKKEGNKILNRSGEARFKFGQLIITGFEPGTFGIEVNDELVPLSCNSGDPGYRENWKEILCESVPDIVAAVGQFAFESVSVVRDNANELSLVDEFSSLFDGEEENPS
jgi:hypothetical protein